MSPKAFEPGWEIGIRKAGAAFIEVGTVRRITYNGRLVVDDNDGVELTFENDGSAVDADEDGFPYLAPLTREWRQERRMKMKLKRLEEIRWWDFEDSVVSQVYDLLERRGAFEWRDDTEDDYSADVKIEADD